MESQYRVGFANVDITPPIGMHIRLGGYSSRLWGAHAKKALDPLMARAFCIRHLEDPSKSIILMTVDLFGLQSQLCRIVRKIISRRTGIPIAQIMMSFTHTHSSPDGIGIFPNRIGDYPISDVQYPVMKYIMRQLIFAANNAFKSATIKAKIGFGFSGKVPASFYGSARNLPLNPV